MKKNTLIFLLVLISLLCCAKKGREQVIEYIKSNFKNWIIEENQLVEKYNISVTEPNFNNQKVYNLIKKVISPSLISLRQKANESKSENNDLKKLKEEFVDKLDFLMEGFSKIEQGLIKNNNILLDEGREALEKYKDKQKRFMDNLKIILDDYKIEKRRN